MRMASQSARPSNAVVAQIRPLAKAFATRSGPMCLMYDSPRFSASGFFGSTSKPITV